MKKTLAVIFTLLLGVVLVSCKKTQDKKPPVGLTDADIVQAAKTQLSLGSADDLSKLDYDLELGDSINVSGTNVSLTWTTSNSESLIIRDGKGLVVLKSTEVSLTLTATIKYNEATDTKEFAITIPAKLNGDVVVASIQEALDTFENKDDKYYEIENELVVIAIGGDGYVLADSTSALLFYRGKGLVEVGDKGYLVAKLNIPFATNPNFDGGQFVKTHEKATDAEIKALAKDSTVEEIMVPKKVDGVEDFNSSMGFFKVTGKIDTQTSGGNTNPYLVSLVNNKNKLVHYYKYENHLQYQAIGETNLTDAGVDVYVFMHDYHSGNKVFRVGFYDVDVELTDEVKANADAAVIVNTAPKIVFNANDKVTLEEKGAFGSDLTYELVTAAHSSILDLATGKVTLPSNLTIVEVKVTAKLNGKTATATFKISIGLPTNVTAFGDLTDTLLGSVIRFDGVVSGVSYSEKYKNGEATLTDSEGNTLLVYRYTESLKGVFVNGDTISVVGVLGKHNGKYQIIAPFGEAVKK